MHNTYCSPSPLLTAPGIVVDGGGGGGSPPVYVGTPTIQAGSEPWPGGTVTATPATTEAELTSVDWEIDGTPLEVFDDFVTVAAGDFAGELVYRQTAENDDGTTEVTTPALDLARVQGVTRGAVTADRPALSATLPASGSMVLRWVGLAFDGTTGVLVAWAANNNVRVSLAASGTALTVALRASGGVGASIVTLPVSDLWDGSTEHRAVVTWTASGGTTDITLDYQPAAGVQTSTTGTNLAAMPGGAADVGILEWGAGISFGVRRDAAAVIEAIGLDRVMTSGERATTLGTSDTIGELRDNANEVWRLTPVESTSVDGDDTTVAGLDGAWTIVAGSARMTDGGLNVATT